MRFADDGGNLRVELRRTALAKMRRLAASALPNETGGIVIGSHDASHRIAVVSSVSAAPRDSASTPWSFRRGVRGLDVLLAQAWKHGEFYLGEWHFHPQAIPEASPADAAQMGEFARTLAMRCPEPLLFIVGLPSAGGRIAAYRTTAHFDRLHRVDDAIVDAGGDDKVQVYPGPPAHDVKVILARPEREQTVEMSAAEF
jgi:hypothetical protein